MQASHLSNIGLAMHILNPHIISAAILISLVAGLLGNCSIVYGDPLLSCLVQLLHKGSHLSHGEAICSDTTRGF